MSVDFFPNDYVSSSSFVTCTLNEILLMGDQRLILCRGCDGIFSVTTPRSAESYPGYYPVGPGGSYPGGKAARK
jgi:hypothetical protein